MTLRLNGSTSGYTEIDAPAVAANNTLTLPTTTNGSLVALDSSGRLGIGTTSANTSIDVRTISTTAYSASNLSAYTGAYISNDGTGGFANITLNAADATGNSNCITAISAISESSGTRNSALAFATRTHSTGNIVERARIDSSGTVLVGNTTQFATSSSTETGSFFTSAGAGVHFASGATPLFIGRQANDGALVSFLQAGVAEGTISVSGTTVSYNGAHLSRWSQLPSGAERTEILRGSILSNIDEMCEWGEEDNEQLNRMKVSDVEGDKNVAGVFQAWDDDDDTYTNDFFCAMTGDFVIRIAQGVTVERGDLLMSAGDGTAKPQDDDIIRSKTIAKVTSTNVSCTYEDGSYCIPCVLMAC
jgi:hypothetical protein